MVCNEIRSRINNGMGMNRDDRDGVGIVRGDPVEIGKFLNTGCAPGAPEVHDGDRAGGCGINGLGKDPVLIYAFQGIAGTAVTNGVAHIRGSVCGIPAGDDRCCQNSRHDPGGDGLQCGALFPQGRGGTFRNFIFLQEDPAAFEPDGLGGTYVDTLAAADALPVTHMADVHFTGAQALAAVDTFVFIQLNTKEGQFVPQSVDCTQRTQEPAEQPEGEDTARQDADHQQEFPGKQRPQHGEVAFVYLIGQKCQTTLQRSGGTDEFAEGGKRDVPEGISNRNDKDKNCKKHIFHPG